MEMMTYIDQYYYFQGAPVSAGQQLSKLEYKCMRRLKNENERENNFEGVYSENVPTLMNESMVKINSLNMKMNISIENQVYCENEKIDCLMSVKFLNPLSVSNWWVGRVSVTSLMAAWSKSILSADNCPINTPLTPSLTSPSPGIGESSQHQGQGTPCLYHTSLLEVTWSHSLLSRDVASVGIHSEFPIIGPRHSHTHPINYIFTNVDPFDIEVVKGVTLIGDSNSPMPPPVGGILDTPCATFHSRIPVDLSLWIVNHESMFIELNGRGLIILLSARSPRYWVNLERATAGTYSKLLRFLFPHHGERQEQIDVIDTLFVIELICLLTPLPLIYHFLLLKITCQVFREINIKTKKENKFIL